MKGLAIVTSEVIETRKWSCWILLMSDELFLSLMTSLKILTVTVFGPYSWEYTIQVDGYVSTRPVVESSGISKPGKETQKQPRSQESNQKLHI